VDLTLGALRVYSWCSWGFTPGLPGVLLYIWNSWGLRSGFLVICSWAPWVFTPGTLGLLRRFFPWDSWGFTLGAPGGLRLGLLGFAPGTPRTPGYSLLGLLGSLLLGFQVGALRLLEVYFWNSRGFTPGAPGGLLLELRGLAPGLLVICS